MLELKELFFIGLVSSLASGATLLPDPKISNKRETDVRHSGLYANPPVTETLGSGAFSPLAAPGSFGNVYSRNDYLPQPLYYGYPRYGGLLNGGGGLLDYRAPSYLNYDGIGGGGPFLNPYTETLPGTLYNGGGIAAAAAGIGYPYYPGSGILPRPHEAVDAFYGRLSGYYN